MAEEKKEKFDNYKYQQQYIKENVRFLHVPFNKKFPDEMALLEYLDDHTKKTGEKKGAFVKRLIRLHKEAEETV